MARTTFKAECPVCHRRVKVKPGGTLATHKGKTVIHLPGMKSSKRVNCYGSGSKATPTD